jgi:hypothetical protein
VGGTLANQGFSQILFFKVLNFKSSTSWGQEVEGFNVEVFFSQNLWQNYLTTFP